MPRDWQKTDRIFTRVLDYEGDDREAFLVECCDGDTTLEADVRLCLTRVERSERFLENAPEVPSDTDFESLREAVQQHVNQKRSGNEIEPGALLGSYRIVRPINTGGMGSVYLAERADGQFQQCVAIKVMHQSSGEDFLTERFLRERQILAHLEHANIARLIDGGMTGDGSPYLVMEYVEGKDLMTYASNRELSLAGRLELFLHVCRVVHFAHGKGVIHRDLKPGNILVNDEGEVKLLDFGIARLLAADSAAESTGIGKAMLTPAHASPEQIRGLPTSPLSDVYQLGLVLYQLLAGRLPVGESPRPPTQVKGATRPIDLDFICLKALAVEPEDRYASVLDLIDDTQSFMAGRPVSARQLSAGGRAGRVIARHRLVLGGALALALVMLTLGYFYGYVGFRSPPGSDRPDAGIQSERGGIAYESQQLAPDFTPDLEAYRLYVQGRTLLDMREEAEMRQSLALFREAVRRDPDSAMARVGVADAIALLIDYGFEMPADALNEAEQSARQAIELAPDLGEAYAALGSIDYLKLNGPEALRNARRSIELNPGNADLLGRTSWGFLILGEPEEALVASEQAVALNPLALEPLSNLVLSLLVLGDADRALEEIRSSRLPRAQWDSIQFYEGVVLYHQGRYDEAIDELNDLSISWAGEGPLATTALAQAALGNHDEARRTLLELERRGAHAFLMGLVQMALGDNETAWQTFDSARTWDANSDWPTLSARYFYRNLLGDRVHDPRYVGMLNRINRAWGLPEYREPGGSTGQVYSGNSDSSR